MGIDAEMLVRTRQQFTPREVRNLSVDLVEAFGTDTFLLIPDWVPDEYYENEFTPPADAPGRHALRLIKFYQQDGPDIHPESGESFIELSLMGRYYGEGYERGSITTYLAIAEWLEQRIPDARVFYGGDSSGVLAEQFDRAARERIFAHFCRVGHKPYRGGFGISVFDKTLGGHPACGFCGPRMTETGGSRDYSFYSCGSCEAKVVRHHATGECEAVTHEDKRNDRFMSGFSVAAKRLMSRLGKEG